MRQWAADNLPSTPSSSSAPPLRILECGSGNGTLLLSFLSSKSGPPQKYNLTGIDYSSQAIDLARGVEAARRGSLADGSYESDSGSEDDGRDESDEEGTAPNGHGGRVLNDVSPIDWRVADLLLDPPNEQWDLVLDKGTFDALCLSSEEIPGTRKLPSRVYPEQVARLVKEGGYFLVTSCNFTEEEIKRRWTVDGLGFVFQ